MYVNLLVAVSCGLAGLLCGWFAYPSLTLTSEPSNTEPTKPAGEDVSASAIAVGSEKENEQIREVSQRLAVLTTSMSVQVSSHQREVRTASDEMRHLEISEENQPLLSIVNRVLDASETLRDQLAKSQQKVEQQAELLQTAEQRALTDSLTRVANRRAFDNHLETLVRTSGRRTSTLMMFDIDHFKKFNDAYGHQAGDFALRAVGRSLDYHTQSQGMVARFGGEEFAVVYDHLSLSECVELAEQTRQLIGEQCILFEDQQLRVKASIGLAELVPAETVETTIEDWIRRADRALYQSKQTRNCGHIQLNGRLIKIGDEIEPEPLKDAGDRLKSLPRGLQGLPRGKRMMDEFGELANGLSGVGLAFITAVVRIDKSAADPDQLQVLARTVRSVIRSVDRIGLQDERTLVIAMPNVDRESAMQRAERIRSSMMYACDDGLGIGHGSVTVSVALCSSCEKLAFADMLKSALKLYEKSAIPRPDQTLAAWSV